MLELSRSWEFLRVLRVDEDPENQSKSCKPFSKNRTGIVLGEGAAMVVLEEIGKGRGGGAPILHGFWAMGPHPMPVIFSTQPALEGVEHKQ